MPLSLSAFFFAFQDKKVHYRRYLHVSSLWVILLAAIVIDCLFALCVCLFLFYACLIFFFEVSLFLRVLCFKMVKLRVCLPACLCLVNYIFIHSFLLPDYFYLFSPIPLFYFVRLSLLLLQRRGAGREQKRKQRR